MWIRLSIYEDKKLHISPTKEEETTSKHIMVINKVVRSIVWQRCKKTVNLCPAAFKHFSQEKTILATLPLPIKWFINEYSCNVLQFTKDEREREREREERGEDDLRILDLALSWITIDRFNGQ